MKKITIILISIVLCAIIPVAAQDTETFRSLLEKKAGLLEEVRQVDTKGFEELPRDIVAVPRHELKPEPANEQPNVSGAALDSAYSSEPYCRYLLSARPELLIVLDEISSVGAIFELGLINKNGWLISLDFGGGLHYYGAGLNIGYYFTTNNGIAFITGLSGNYHSTDLVVHIEDKDGNTITKDYGINKNYVGFFWKIMPCKKANIDITNKFLFGHRRDSAWYDKESKEVFMKNTPTATYSLTVGATLIKRRK